MKEKAKQEKTHEGSRTVNRRAFIALGAAATASVAAAQTKVVKGRMKKNDPDPAQDVAAVTDEEFDGAIRQLEATGMYDDAKRLPALRVVQRAIDRMSTSRAFLPCLHSQTPQKRIDAIHAEFPVMRWYDRAFDRVFDQFVSTKVTGDTPAIWYLYNMGILVKTKSCAFGIDVFHRQDMRLVEHLDFLLVTHNHGDHHDPRMLNAMRAADKPVISNFYLCKRWYCREFDKTFKFKDVTIHTVAADHQTWLPWAVTTFEVVCGDGPDAFTIFHSGDCNRHDHLKPKGRPDIFMGHCAIGLDFLKAARETMPAKLFLTLHHQELGHIPGKYRCVAFEDEPLQRVRGLREAGFKAAMPVWGDRIV